jgi:LysR family transcriptional regulator (chromosome initiation inhibitor)
VKLIDYHRLAALVAVLREGSFEAAAGALHVTPSAISQRVKQLEDDLGQVLVIRAAPCRATVAGERMLRHALAVELLERDLWAPGTVAAAGARRVEVVVPIAVNQDSLSTWFVDVAVACFRASGLLLDVTADDQDHTAEWLRSGRVLAAVTTEASPVQGCSVVRLGAMRYRATAPPAFVRQWFSGGVTVAALSQAPVIVGDRRDRLPHAFARKLVGRTRRDLPWPAHRLPSTHGGLAANLHGLGWAVHPEAMIERELSSGALVDIAPREALDIGLYWQCWRLDTPSLQQLSRTVVNAASAALHRRRRGADRTSATVRR